MLTAIYREKTRFHLRYKGRRDDLDQGRITAEDEITSLVFEPMQYLSAGEVVCFWREVIGGDFLPKESPTSFDMKFWPRFRNLEDGDARHWVEPDLRIDFSWSNGDRRIILLEIKWDSPLSDGQLLKQWNNCLEPDEQKAARHIFISKRSDIDREDRHGCVVVKSWRDVQGILKGYEGANGVAIWARLVVAFLGRVIPRPFDGFKHINPLKVGNSRFYVRDDFFDGETLCGLSEVKSDSLSFYQR